MRTCANGGTAKEGTDHIGGTEPKLPSEQPHRIRPARQCLSIFKGYLEEKGAPERQGQESRGKRLQYTVISF